MLNYEVDPAILAPYIPAGTTLDLWQGKALVSLVGFLFLNTRLLGIPVPYHRNFEEVNLRFYVKQGTRRGVCFIKEIVPRWSIAYLARKLYNEKYVSTSMRHRIEHAENWISVDYEWKWQDRWQKLGA